jgi:hypothetical protein
VTVAAVSSKARAAPAELAAMRQGPCQGDRFQRHDAEGAARQSWPLDCKVPQVSDAQSYPAPFDELATAGELQEPMTDNWRENVLLVCISTEMGPTAVILSAGPDRKFGTDDDRSSAAEQ